MLKKTALFLKDGFPYQRNTVYGCIRQGAGSVEELLEIKTRPRKWLDSTVLVQKAIWRLDSTVLAHRKTWRWLSNLNQNFLLADFKQCKRANSSRDETPVYSCHVIFLCRMIVNK